MDSTTLYTVNLELRAFNVPNISESAEQVACGYKKTERTAHSTNRIV